MTKTTKRRVIVWSVVGAATIAVLALAVIPRPILVDFGAVTRGPLEVTLDHEGVTRVHDRFVVSAPVQGRVLRVELEPGDAVSAGVTVIARFLPAAPVPLDARLRAEGGARVKTAQAALEGARADRGRARAQLMLAEAERARIKALAGDGIVSRQELDQAEAAARAQASAVEAADAAMQAALHQLEAANAGLIEPRAATSASQGLSGALALRAPVNGVVLRRLQESEAVVAPGTPLVEVADPADLEVVADYLSTDAVRIRPGMPVRIDQWGGVAALQGRVRRIEPAGFMKISALGVEEQRVWVVVDFLDPREAWKALGDGYRVQTRVVTWQRDSVLKVPNSALFREGDAWAVFLVEAGRARVRTIEIGERNDTVAQLLTNLPVGSLIIVHPPDGVADGTRVSRR